MNHEKIETNSILLLVLSLIVVTIGGIVEIVPLFFLQSTIEKVQGMRPYTPLEQAGRDIYIREGCYLCHSQMIRTLRDEVERYGHYSLAAESMYDHPFQWGSKRTGPDLARVGGKYSDKWHVEHMNNPRAVVPESIMPSYGWLSKTPLDYANIGANLKALRVTGVPYTDEMIAKAKADVEAQVKPDSKEAKELVERYKKVSDGRANVKVAKFDTGTEKITELDALVAYLQMLGTLVDFAKYDETGPNLR